MDFTTTTYGQASFEMSPIYWVWCIFLCVLSIVAFWKLFTKAGEAGWKCLIPIYNLYIMFKIVYGSGWKFLLLLIPLVNIVVLILYYVDLAKCFNKGTGFALGLIFLSGIFMLILAFDKSEYIGPKSVRT